MTQKAKLKGYADFRERIKEERVQIGGRSTPLPDADGRARIGPIKNTSCR